MAKPLTDTEMAYIVTEQKWGGWAEEPIDVIEDMVSDGCRLCPRCQDVLVPGWYQLCPECWQSKTGVIQCSHDSKSIAWLPDKYDEVADICTGCGHIVQPTGLFSGTVNSLRNLARWLLETANDIDLKRRHC